jgi:hypothetical protein
MKLSDLGNVTLTHDKLLPSFTSYGLTLEYELQVEIWGECAKHEFSGLACRTQVQIVSGWNLAHNTAEYDGMSTPGLDARPAYQETDPMAVPYDYPPPLHELETDTGPRPYSLPAMPPSRMEVASRPMPPPYMG